ncbi:MAG: MerR family transcriptional regulator [Treponema sp.]|nr:MerR family transcriptional regulator [Treponema sp.]
MDDSLLRIGEIAAFFNISVKAVRLYDKLGILKPVKIDAVTGYRYYSVDQVHELNALIELKHLGFSLAEIRDLLGGGMKNEQFMEALVHKKADWQGKINSIQNRIAAIDKITGRLSSGKPAVKMHKLTEEERAWLLVKLVCVEDLRVQSQLSEAIWL